MSTTLRKALGGIPGQDHMCPFGMTGVPVRKEYFGRLEEAVQLVGLMASSRTYATLPHLTLLLPTGASSHRSIKGQSHFGVSFVATVAGDYTMRGCPFTLVTLVSFGRLW